VLSIAARYVNNAEDAKDIYQEVFIRVFRGLRNFKMNSEFTTWLFRITTNVCLTFCKKNRYTSSNFSDFAGNEHDDPDLKIDSGNMTSGGVQHMVNREISDRVSNALEKLSPQQKMIFMMKHYEGYKLMEIAKFLKCTEGTVKKQLFIAIRRLRIELKDLHMEGALE
jgi:RNA polymerase sigma-70 factor (ECF subfamily)